jgi:hypothetical protein
MLPNLSPTHFTEDSVFH